MDDHRIQPASPPPVPPLADLLDAIPLGLQFAAEQDGRQVVVFASRRFCELLGIEAAGIVGLEDAAALERIAAHLESPLDEAASADDRSARTRRVVTRGEPRRVLECDTGPVHDGRGRVIGRTRIVRDVTKIAAADAAHAESEARLAGIVASAMDAIITVDEDQRVVVFNAAAERAFGVPAHEALGRALDDFVPERFRSAHREHVRTFGHTNVTRRAMGRLNSLYGVRSSGEEFPIEASISQVEILGRKLFTVILRDITEKRRAEAQLLRAQRLESVGTLAGGLAHDLNNILAPIMMSVQLLERKLADDPEGLECTAMLQGLAERGARIIRQVLSFARGGEGDRVPMDVKHVIGEVVQVLRETLPRDIVVRSEGIDDLWTVRADATQIHQVIMNLALNSRDAMPRGGSLTIEARNVMLDLHFAQMHPEASPGRYVAISVADTGTGIAPEDLDRIFDPFFTTKKQGQGSGLGLSTTLGILRAHGGFINVYSEPEHGTRLTVYLPALETEVPARGEEAGLPAPRGRGQLVMVVDDEAAIRTVTAQALTAYGYRVLTAADGTQAVGLFAERRGEIAAVVLDMMMPFMDGNATERELRRIDASVRVLRSSGLAAKVAVTEAEGGGPAGILAKPYTADQLLRALAGVLRGG